MQKQNQITALLLTCIVILGSLIYIQCNLVRKVYDLEKRDYVKEVKDSISAVAEAPELHVLEDSLNETFKKLILQKVKDSLSDSEFKYAFYYKTDSIKNLGNAFLKSQENEYPILKDLILCYRLTEMIFRYDAITDTLISLRDEPLIYFGEKLSEGESFNLSFGNFYTTIKSSSDTDGIQNDLSLDFFTKHSVDVDISDWQYQVLYRMKWILGAAIFLLLAVVALFFFMFRALIRQRKIAEIKTDFANNITHELKTPLTSMGLIVKSLKNDTLKIDADEREKLIETLDRQNRRLQEIVDRVMETSIGRPNLMMTNTEIVGFLKNFATDFRSESHDFRYKIEPEVLWIKTDAYQMGRVLQNLLQNAEKFSDKNSEIFMHAYPTQDYFIVEIKDCGIGISKNEQEKIFDKFYRISEGNLHNTHGLGLGLYYCKEIMKSLGGKIEVESEINKGSKFILKFPIS